MPLRYYSKIEQIKENKITLRTAAVCVYPSRVAAAAKVIKSMKLSDELQVAAGKIV